MGDDAADARNRRMFDTDDCLSEALSQRQIKIGWRQTGLWPFDPEVALRRKMYYSPYEGLPEELKRKRGLSLKNGSIRKAGGEIIRLPEEDKENAEPNTTEQQPKKRKKN